MEIFSHFSSLVTSFQYSSMFFYSTIKMVKILKAVDLKKEKKKKQSFLPYCEN